MDNTETTEQSFNYRSFRGSKILRVIEHLEIALKTLQDQLTFQKEMENDIAMRYIEGRIKGLENAIDLIKSEFEMK